LIDSTRYGYLLNLVTYGATKQGLIKWGGYNVFNSVPNSTAGGFAINSLVLSDSYLAFNQELWIGNIINNHSDYIIDISSVVFPVVDNGVLHAQWTGAGSSSSLSDFTALMMASVWSDGGAKTITGTGDTFILDASNEFFNADVRFQFNFRDMVFKFNPSDASQSFGFRNDTKLKNVEFRSNGGTELLILSFGDGTRADSGNAPVIEFINCNVTSFYGTNLIGAFIKATNTLFKSDFGSGLDATTGEYFNCEFTDAVVFTQRELYQSYLKVYGCTFSDGLTTTFKVGVDISSNIIQKDGPAIAINMPNWATTHESIIVKNNTINYVGVLPDTLYGITASKGNGHINCVIDDNIFNLFKVAGTRRILRLDTSMDDVSHQREYFDNLWVLLPNLAYDTDRFLPYTAQVTIQPTDPVSADTNVVSASVSRIWPYDVFGGDYGKFVVEFKRIETDSAYSCFITLDVSVNGVNSKDILS
jgi:hypothetical protein